MKELRYDVLVNRENMLDKSYVPKKLFVLDNNENNFHRYLDPNNKPSLREDIILDVFYLLYQARLNDINFIIDSGYRSYLYQKAILEENFKAKGALAYKTVALPGASEHQTGLAFDIAYYNNGIYSDTVLETDAAYKWLIENSYKYGFILRYPKGKEDITGFSFEPWHYRYVGKDLAMELTRKKITLDEYYQ